MTQCIQYITMSDVLFFATIVISMAIGVAVGTWYARMKKPTPIAIPVMTEKKTKRGTSTLPPKFTGPNGETWHGKGREPAWMKELIATGSTKDDFISSEWASAKG